MELILMEAWKILAQGRTFEVHKPFLRYYHRQGNTGFYRAPQEVLYALGTKILCE